MRTSVPLILVLAALVGCGGTPESKRTGAAPAAAAPRAKDLDKATQDKLRRFELLYRKLGKAPDPATEQELAQLRVELCGTPDSSLWLARLFVRDAIVALDAGGATEADFVQVVVAPKNTVLDRAVGQLVAMGPNAVPCVRDDLLRHAYADRRELGVRLLHAIGPASIPAISPLAGAEDPALRRAAIETLAGMQEESQAQTVVDKALADPHFAVRGAAYQALARRGDAQLGALCRALGDDPDPYVRRTIAKELARFPDPSAREALLAFRARCVKEKDSRSLEAADEALAARGRK